MFDGKLMSFNGPLPPFQEASLIPAVKPDLTSLTIQDMLDRTANYPSSNGHFFPKINFQNPPDADKSKTQVFVPPPTGTTQSSSPGRSGTPGRNPNY